MNTCCRRRRHYEYMRKRNAVCERGADTSVTDTYRNILGNMQIICLNREFSSWLIDSIEFDVTNHGYGQRVCVYGCHICVYTLIAVCTYTHTRSNTNWLHTIKGFLLFSWHNWRYGPSVCFKLISDQIGFVVIWYLRFKLTIINWVISVIYVFA